MASSSIDLSSDLVAPKAFVAEEIQAALAKAIELGWCQHGEDETTFPISGIDMEAVLQAGWEQSGRWKRISSVISGARLEMQTLTAARQQLEDDIRQLREEKASLLDQEDFYEVVERFLDWLQTWHSGLLMGFDAYAEIKRRVNE